MLGSLPGSKGGSITIEDGNTIESPNKISYELNIVVMDGVEFKDN